MTERTPLSSIDGNRIFIRNEVWHGRNMLVFYRATTSLKPKPIMMVEESHFFDGEGNYFDNDLPITEVRIG